MENYTQTAVSCVKTTSVVPSSEQGTQIYEYEVDCYIQWGEQVFDTLPILQVFLLTKHVEVCNFYHRYTSTVRDGI